MFVQKLFLVTLCVICLVGCAWSHVLAGHHSLYDGISLNNGGYGHGHHSAVKISGDNWADLHRYGHEIGKPLLVKDYGKLTNLFSALAPERSFVGRIDPGFHKDHYGGITYRGESAVGALAL